MKRILPVIFILVSFHSLAQWNLFPYQQVSFYRPTDSSDNWINFYRFINDSIQNTGNEECLYFNRYPNPHSKSPCYYEPYRHYALRDTLYLDSIFKFGNEYHYYLNGDTFIFHSDAIVGQQWIVNCQNGGSDYLQLQITCNAITYDSLPGTHDSVKHFILQTLPASIAPVDGFEILLSKNFGMLRFIPFFYLLNQNSLPEIPVIQLRGMRSNGNDFGYHIPGFKEIFSIEPGTVLESHYVFYFNGGAQFCPDFTHTYRDSVISISFEGDTMITLSYIREAEECQYDFNCQIHCSSGGPFLPAPLLIKSSPYLGMFGRSIHELSYSDYWTGIAGYPFPAGEIDGCYNGDFRYGPVSNDLDTSTCSFSYFYPFEFGYCASFKVGVGFTGESYGGWEVQNTYYTQVQYCLPNDSNCFIPHLVTGVESLQNFSNLISIFPNPASDQFFIHHSNPSLQVQKAQLLQLDGKVLKEFISDDEQKFSVKNITEGIYIVSVQTNEGFAYSKLLVAR